MITFNDKILRCLEFLVDLLKQGRGDIRFSVFEKFFEIKIIIKAVISFAAIQEKRISLCFKRIYNFGDKILCIIFTVLFKKLQFFQILLSQNLNSSLLEINQLFCRFWSPVYLIVTKILVMLNKLRHLLKCLIFESAIGFYQ